MSWQRPNISQTQERAADWQTMSWPLNYSELSNTLQWTYILFITTTTTPLKNCSASIRQRLFIQSTDRVWPTWIGGPFTVTPSCPESLGLQVQQCCCGPLYAKVILFLSLRIYFRRREGQLAIYKHFKHYCHTQNSNFKHFQFSHVWKKWSPWVKTKDIPVYVTPLSTSSPGRVCHSSVVPAFEDLQLSYGLAPSNKNIMPATYVMWSFLVATLRY